MISEVKTAGDLMRAQTLEEFQKFRDNMELWYAGIKAHVEKNGGGFDGKGKGGGEGKGSTRADKKDIAVWKLPDDLDKLSFRHWVDAVDQQLEAVHGFKHASFVMNEICRSEVEITAGMFTTCIEKANVKIGQSLEAMGVKGEELNGVTDDTHGDFCDYKFLDMTTLFNSYLICKINTHLHTKTFGLDHKNGFELYRLVCQLVDAIPENAAFHLNNELLNLTKMHGGKVTDLRTLYGFRLLLKRKVAEFKKVVRYAILVECHGRRFED